MATTVKRLLGIYNTVVTVMNYLSVLLIFLMALWVSADVCGRYFFNSPIAGTTEFVKVFLCAIVFLGITYAAKQGRHIRTTIIVDRFPPTAQRICDIFASLLGLAIFTLIVYYGWEEAWCSWVVREFDGVEVEVPVYPSRFMVVLGSGLLIIHFFINLMEATRKLWGPADKD